jgi:hypothetical protein
MRTLLAASGLSILLAAGSASAQVAPRERIPAGGMDRQVSLWGLWSYRYAYGGVGLGARYQVTVLPQGLLQAAGVRDDIGIEGGLDYVHYAWDSGARASWTFDELSLVAGGVWNFWLAPQLALYPKLDLGIAFGSWTDRSVSPGVAGHPSSSALILQGAIGAVYRLDRFSLRLELGSAYLRGGLAFTF